MNLPKRIACPGGVTNPKFSAPAFQSRWQFLRLGISFSASLAAVSMLIACGIEAPPQPPRLEQPQQIRNLQVAQRGASFRLSFTLPVLATDGERLNKPVELELFHAVAPPGRHPQQPDTNAAPWVVILPRELANYTQGPNIVYPVHFSEDDIRQQQGSMFLFSVIALTRGFRKHPHKSEPSNVTGTNLVNVAEPPQNLSVTPSQTQLRLAWNRPKQNLTSGAASNLSAYHVYVSETGKTNSFHLLAETSANQYDDDTFQFGQIYFFYVTAVSTEDSTQAESDPSQIVTIKPRDVFPPVVPQGLTAVYTAGAIDLLWNANTDTDLAGYNVYKESGDEPFKRVNTQLLPTPIFHDTAVAAGKSYQYAVTVVDLSGNESAKSEAVRISTSPTAGH